MIASETKTKEGKLVDIKNGAKENQQTMLLTKKTLNTRDALRAAARKGCLAAVRFLVEEGVNKTDADKQGQTPLMLATQNDHLAVVQFLEEEQPTDNDKEDMLLIKKELNTCDALCVASQRGAVETVCFLVEEGVNKDDVDKDGWTPLSNAALKGHLAVIQYLLEHGADKEKATNIGRSPLWIAAQQGHLTVVQYLLEQGADKGKNSNEGASPLYIAALNCHLGVVQYLLEHGADKDKLNNNGASPLYMAAQNGHLVVVQYLLEHGADVNKADNNGWSPLHIAALHGHADILTCLMNWGASLTARNTATGRLPIGAAANEAIRQLIRDEEIRRRDHGYKRAVLPNPTAAERANGYLACLGGDHEGQGQASASATAEEDDDDSGSDEEHEVAYLKSLKRQRTK